MVNSINNAEQCAIKICSKSSVDGYWMQLLIGEKRRLGIDETAWLGAK